MYHDTDEEWLNQKCIFILLYELIMYLLFTFPFAQFNLMKEMVLLLTITFVVP